MPIVSVSRGGCGACGLERTTMPSNLKKLIQARRAKTGESYQTALRHIKAQAAGPGRGRFEHVVRGIIHLGKQRNALDIRSSVRDTGVLPVRHAAEIGDRLDADDAGLREALERLPRDVLHKLEALMYSGRDRCDVLEVFHEFPKEDKRATVESIFSKRPLDEYLEAGLRIARARKLDLEADFAEARPSEPPRSYVIDMTHTIQALDPDAVVPEPTRRFAEYVGSIVLVATAVPRGRTTSTKLPCRHCSEFVEVRVIGEPARAEWGCPGCGEKGVVSNWRGTPWDASSGDRTMH